MMLNKETYLCNQVHKGKKERLTSDWKKVTCQNCLIIDNKLDRFREAINNESN